MNNEESIVNSFLLNEGYKSIEFEPSGESKPPDFTIRGNIAIEVRRLNKHIRIDDRVEPIERFKFKFEPRLRKKLKELEQYDLPYSIGVSLSYKRPLKISEQLLNELKESIFSSALSEQFDVVFNNQISYSLIKGNEKTKTYGNIILNDLDIGGVVQNARYEALKISIVEKSKKLEHLKDQYNEIWLILVDDIFSRVDETINRDLKRYPEVKSYFKRIILISKRDTSNWINLNPWIDIS